ncbi:hypothetical protein I4U23_024651 [Adineta vaga]|nr:hypothetical protein I4U23_024651 [Adineta vaga]
MDNITLPLVSLNGTDVLCPQPLLWTESAIENRRARLIVCIAAIFTHSIFWLQLAFCSSVRQSSMQWLYAYLVTDIFLLFRYFFIYIIYTTTADCNPNRSWVLFMYYFEALLDNYMNILEVYILLALNVCRYIQIAYNRNVYRIHTKSLILSHLLIYILPAISLFVQFYTGWSQIKIIPRDSCQVVYTNIYIQVFNVITAFALPIFLNILVIYMSVRHVRLTSTLQRAAHHVSAREKYNRSLVIQFLLFYIIWVSLWSPNVIVFQISISDDIITRNVRLLNFIEIVLDPIIIAALDVRFWQEWRRTFLYVKTNQFRSRTNAGRVQPTTTNAQKAVSNKNPRLQTTKF